MADDRLFQAGDAEAVDNACRRSAVGKLLPNALYVHRRALESLDPLLRVYEGCARAYLGEIEGANLIKLHRQSGKVSYLVYPDFETDPHPALLRSIKLNLRSREIDSIDYARSANPPILHRKATFLPPDHPLRAKFERLTRQEERAGLLDETATIGTRSGWAERLRRWVMPCADIDSFGPGRAMSRRGLDRMKPWEKGARREDRKGWVGRLTTGMVNRPVPIKPVSQICEEFVVRDADDPLGIDDDVLATPTQAILFPWLHVLVTADDQHTRIVDGTLPESGLHRGRI